MFYCSLCLVCSLLNYSALDGQMFCKPHFLEVFKRKGMPCSDQLFVHFCKILIKLLYANMFWFLHVNFIHWLNMCKIKLLRCFTFVYVVSFGMASLILYCFFVTFLTRQV